MRRQLRILSQPRPCFCNILEYISICYIDPARSGARHRAAGKARLTMSVSLKLSIFRQFAGVSHRRSIRDRGLAAAMNAAPLASESEKTALSRERADRRRSVVRTVREQRERL